MNLAHIAERVGLLKPQSSRIPDIQPRTADPPPYTSMLDSVRDQVIAVGLRRLFEQAHFSICGLETLLTAARIVPDGETMRILHCLHCVGWADMPKELREKVWAIIVGLFRVE